MKVALKKKIINIYRPPKNRIDNFCEFTEEITPNWFQWKRITERVYIAGGFNIDLLKLNEKEVYGEFFDNLTEKMAFIQRLHFQQDSPGGNKFKNSACHALP